MRSIRARRGGRSFGISSELLLGLLSATARIRDSVNHSSRVLYYKALRAVNCRAYYDDGANGGEKKESEGEVALEIRAPMLSACSDFASARRDREDWLNAI